MATVVQPKVVQIRFGAYAVQLEDDVVDGPHRRMGRKVIRTVRTVLRFGVGIRQQANQIPPRAQGR